MEKSPNLRWKQPQNAQNNFSNPPNRFQPNSSFLNRPFNKNPQNFSNQSNIKGLVSNFMASKDGRLSKFEVDLKQQQSEMTNKIDTVLKAITDRMTGALSSNMVKNSKLNVNSTSLVLSARSYPTEDPQCSTRIPSLINAIMISPKQPKKSCDDKSEEEGQEEKGSPLNINTTLPSPPDPSISFITEKVRRLNSFLESSGLVPRSSDTKFVCTKEDDRDVMFIEIIKKYDDSREEELRENENATIGGPEVEYSDTFLTRSELAYHKYLMSGPIPSIFLRNTIITEGCPSNLKIPCNIRHVHIMRRKLDPREDPNRGVSNFIGRVKGIHIFVGNFTYVLDFMIVEDISSIIDLRLSQVVLGKPFIEVSNMSYDLSSGVVRFMNEAKEIANKMPHKIDQYNLLSDLEKEDTKFVYFRNEEDKRRGVDYVIRVLYGMFRAWTRIFNWT
ncbi:hypothetical protein Tco_1084996 [Tanacetum coccineum]